MSLIDFILPKNSVASFYHLCMKWNQFYFVILLTESDNLDRNDTTVCGQQNQQVRIKAKDFNIHNISYVHFNFANFYVTFHAFLFPQRNGDDLVYSKPTFLRMKADRADRVKARRREDTIYSDVRAFDGN